MPISSDMYALTPCDVVVMYPRVYIYVSGQKIPHASATLFSYRLRVSLLIANAIHAPPAITYIFSRIHFFPTLFIFLIDIVRFYYLE